MRLLVTLGPQLDDDELARLERAILAGPTRDMYRADIEEERWTRIQESEVWLRLAKISQAGARLSTLVNKPAHDDPRCVEPVGAPLPCGSDPPRQPPTEPPHKAPRRTSLALVTTDKAP